MSIVTKTGDRGTTAMMYGRRVSKCHPRVEAYGCVDELNTVLGLARATANIALIKSNLLTVQQDLITVMGELATADEDLPRYVKDGYALVTSQLTRKLDAVIAEIETHCVSFHRLEDVVGDIAANTETFKGWATPGGCLSSAALEMARTVCRRAERRVCALQETDRMYNSEILVYLNRLADLLWLMARWVETNPDPNSIPDV